MEDRDYEDMAVACKPIQPFLILRQNLNTTQNFACMSFHILVFERGKLIIAGAKSEEEVLQAYNNAVKLLSPYRLEVESVTA